MPALLKNENLPEIQYSEVIRAPRTEVFKAMTTARILDEWGAGPARFQAKPGGKWSLWDGIMHGVVKEIHASDRIVFTLREIHWHERELDSLVTIELADCSRLPMLREGRELRCKIDLAHG